MIAARQTQEAGVTESTSSPPTATRPVYLDVVDGVATIRLDHPRRNVIDLRLATQLHDAALEVGHRDDVGAVVVWGGNGSSPPAGMWR